MSESQRRELRKGLGRGARGAYPNIRGRGAHLWEFPGVTPADDSTATQWLVGALDHRWVQRRGVLVTVASFVPTGFAAYARVFHPVPRTWESDENGMLVAPVPLTLRWADVASWSGQTLRSDSDFHQLATPPPGRSPQPADLHITDPVTFSEAPPELLGALATILQAHTTTPDACWFALWDGYGDLGLSSDGGPARLHLPGRSYLLYTGPVTAATAFATPGAPHAPTLWWPADRAWFVGSDVDLDSSYVGGTEATIDQLLRQPDIEALPTSADTQLG
jgi:hypothetical protein